MRLIDISPCLHPGVAVWPGDVPFRRTVAMSMAAGDHLTLSSIQTTVHVGAHTDAPNHYARDGEDIASRSLAPYFGPCQIVEVSLPRARRILPEDVRAHIQAERLLFRTSSFPDPDVFNEDFNSLSPELVHWLADRGVRLVGLDTPSVDPFHSKALEAHSAIAERDMAILEGVVLEGVEPGVYTLAAFPLKIRGADASPVRAVLIDDR